MPQCDCRLKRTTPTATSATPTSCAGVTDKRTESMGGAAGGKKLRGFDVHPPTASSYELGMLQLHNYVWGNYCIRVYGGITVSVCMGELLYQNYCIRVYGGITVSVCGSHW